MLKKYFRKPKRVVVVKSSTKHATEAVTEKCFKKVLFERGLSAAIVSCRQSRFQVSYAHGKGVQKNCHLAIQICLKLTSLIFVTTERVL